MPQSADPAEVFLQPGHIWFGQGTVRIKVQVRNVDQALHLGGHGHRQLHLDAWSGNVGMRHCPLDAPQPPTPPKPATP